MNALWKMAAKSCREDKSKWLAFVTHSFDTAAVMDRLFMLWISQHDREYIARQLKIVGDIDESINIAQRVCRLIALLHDTGKLSNEFQCKITDNIEGHRLLLQNMGFTLNELGNSEKKSHAACGAAILEEFGFSNGLITIVASHHGRTDEYFELINIVPENFFGHNCESEQQWRELWEEWIGICLERCGFETPEDVPELNVKLQMLITALLIMSDWIASNTGYFPLAESFDVPEDTERRADNAFEKLDLPPYWEADINTFDFEDRFKFMPNTVQQEVMDIVSEASSVGIYILEAPMGLGKTEAALSAAEILADKFGCGGIYFGLPTQATANGIFERILSWAKQQCDSEKHTIRLAHGMTELNEEYRSIFHGRANDISDDTKVYVHEWFEGRKQALLADFVIGTVDQFLLASLKQKHVMLRHLGLSGKVVIIDECHAYDAYMNVYLDKTLAWMGAYEVPVIILSATLPVQRRNELIKAYLNSKKEIDIPIQENAYPVLTWTDGKIINSRMLSSDQTDKNISVSRINEEDIPDQLAEKLKYGGCAAIIVNTVGYAQKLSKILSEQLDGYEIICFHSRFTATDRADIEKTLLKRVGKMSGTDDRERLIIVGTQVIEQSLDIDLDYMITEICPMDLLLQRAGRLHRHERIRPKGLECAELSVISEISIGTEKVYDKWLLKQTEKYLPDELIIPGCIPELIGKVYGSPSTPDEDHDRYIKNLADKEQRAQKYCIMANKLKSSTSLENLLDDNVGNSTDAEASVRDSGETIEVLLMCEGENNDLRYLPWRNDGISIDTTCEPTEEEALLTARERLRLPMFFSLPYNIKNTIKELCLLPERWQNVPLLKGELMLVLNKELETELLGRKLRYSKEYGLEEIKEGYDGQ